MNPRGVGAKSISLTPKAPADHDVGDVAIGGVRELLFEVQNDRGDPIPGAAVTASPGGRTATTDASGRYTLTGIAVGTYQLTASRSGFAPATRRGVEVRESATTTVDFALSPATTSGPSTGVSAADFFSSSIISMEIPARGASLSRRRWRARSRRDRRRATDTLRAGSAAPLPR